MDARLETLIGRARRAGATPSQLADLESGWGEASDAERLRAFRTLSTAAMRAALPRTAPEAAQVEQSDPKPPVDVEPGPDPENGPPAGAQDVIAWVSVEPTARRMAEAWQAELDRPRGPRVTVRDALAALGFEPARVG